MQTQTDRELMRGNQVGKHRRVELSHSRAAAMKTTIGGELL